jgi:hypothetical protein
MGRHCGYLAWAAAIACGADFVLIPESPPEMEDWETVMCNKLEKVRRAWANWLIWGLLPYLRVILLILPGPWMFSAAVASALKWVVTLDKRLVSIGHPIYSRIDG